MNNNSNYISKRYNSTKSGVDYGFSTKSTEEIASHFHPAILKCAEKVATLDSTFAFYRIARRYGITPDEVSQLVNDRFIKGGDQ